MLMGSLGYQQLLNKQPKTVANTLVLKSEYNLAWNYFNAHEFEQTVFVLRFPLGAHQLHDQKSRKDMTKKSCYACM